MTKSFGVLVAALVLLGSCGGAREPMLGKWQESSNAKQIEFFADGTVALRTPDGEQAGDFRRLDASRLRVELGGAGTLAGPQIVRCDLKGPDTALIAFGVEEAETYKRVDQFSDPPQGPLEKMRQTMADLRSIATAVESYSVDHDRYPVAPEGPVSQLVAVLEPTYIGRIPPTDAWGTPILWVGNDGLHYTLASFGTDLTRDLTWQGGITHSLARDIVFEDGQFSQWPEGHVTPF